MWNKGNLDGFNYFVKHYEEGSEFGIKGGRISKLEIRKDGKIVVNYDRGFDIRPADTEVKKVYNKILKMYN